MGVREKIFICIAMVVVAVFFICAGIAIVWMAIEDTAFGRAIDEIMGERIERWKERASNGR